MKHAVVTRSHEVDLMPPRAKRHLKSDDITLSDFDDVEYLGGIPTPPRGTLYIVGRSPVSGELKGGDYKLDPKTGWYLSRVGGARYAPTDLILGTYED